MRRSWVRILSGTQVFSLSHTRVMLINSPFIFHYQTPYSPSSLITARHNFDSADPSSMQDACHP